VSVFVTPFDENLLITYVIRTAVVMIMATTTTMTMKKIIPHPSHQFHGSEAETTLPRPMQRERRQTRRKPGYKIIY
jgi:hypothetical protein